MLKSRCRVFISSLIAAVVLSTSFTVVAQTTATPQKLQSQATISYYQSLIQRFDSGQEVKLEEFNRTFFPVDPAPVVDRALSCNTYVTDLNCQPDTFYSWGMAVKIESISASTSDRTKPWTGLNFGGGRWRDVFMAQTPLASYCYGDYSVRIKFKKSPLAGPLNHGGDPKFTLNEWIVRNGSHIENEAHRVESISFGQSEHFDELVTELMRRLDVKGPWKNAPLYSEPIDTSSLKSRLLTGCLEERGVSLTESSLVKNLVNMLRVVLSQKGWIHYQSCLDDSCCDHFKTKWPSFFNSK